MTNNAAMFSIELKKELELSEKQVLQVVKKLALETLIRVVYKSPVDTGRFRGNWNVAVDAPDLSTTETVDDNGSGTVNKGNAVVGTIKQPYVAVFLTNNLPYAQRLENGWSNQAPNGMVAVTVAEINSIFGAS